MNAHEKGIEAACRTVSEDPGAELDLAIENALRAYLEASGMVMVPREPTQDMELAGGLKCEGLMFEEDPDYTGVIFRDMGTVYKTMIAAAPSPFSQANTEGEGI